MITNDQTTAPQMSFPAGVPTNSARAASTIVVNGLFSAIGSSQLGIVSTGTNADEMNVTGKRIVKPYAFDASGEDDDDLREAGGEAEADQDSDREHDHELDHVRPDVRHDPARDHGRPPHRERPEPVDQALLEVLGEPERGHEAAEDHRLDDDPGYQEVHVIEIPGVDRAAEDVHEQQHEHDRLDREADQEVGLAWDPLQAPLRQDERVGDRVLDGRHRRSTSSASASSSCSAACPVSRRNTSSRVGRRTAMSSIVSPASSSRRTASAIAPLRSRRGTLITPFSVDGRSLAIVASTGIASSPRWPSQRWISSRSPPTCAFS